MCVLTGVIPIIIKLKNNTDKYHVIYKEKTVVINNHQISRNNIMQKFRTFDCHFYNKINNIIFSDFTDPKCYDSIYPILFTDGSKMESGVSAAFTVYYKGKYIYDYKIKLNELNSIFQAELLAILSALNWVVNKPYTYCYVTVSTDSLSSIYTLKQAFPANSIVFNIFEVLYNNPHILFSFGWVRAHVGTEGNERADSLAKSVITGNIYNEEINLPIPMSYIKNYYTKQSLIDWQSSWSNSEKGRHTYEIIRRVNTDFVCNNQIVQYYASGHWSFPYYLHKIKKRPDSNCICGKEGSVHHYLFGKCCIMKYHFFFDNSRTVRKNTFDTIFNKNNYHKLKSNYNILNKHFSFIRYVF